MYDNGVYQELSPTLETRLIQEANYAAFNEQCPDSFPTALLDLSSKEFLLFSKRKRGIVLPVGNLKVTFQMMMESRTSAGHATG
jgi:hypothetical protein